MNDDLPEPLGPTTMFNRADGAMTHFSCVINFSRTTCLMLLHAKGGAQSQAAPITPPVPFKKTKFTNHRRDVHAAGGLPVAFDPSHRHSARATNTLATVKNIGTQPRRTCPGHSRCEESPHAWTKPWRGGAKAVLAVYELCPA